MVRSTPTPIMRHSMGPHLMAVVAVLCALGSGHFHHVSGMPARCGHNFGREVKQCLDPYWSSAFLLQPRRHPHPTGQAFVKHLCLQFETALACLHTALSHCPSHANLRHVQSKLGSDWAMDIRDLCVGQSQLPTHRGAAHQELPEMEGLLESSNERLQDFFREEEGEDVVEKVIVRDGGRVVVVLREGNEMYPFQRTGVYPNRHAGGGLNRNSEVYSSTGTDAFSLRNTDAFPFRRTDLQTDAYPFTGTDAGTDAYPFRKTDVRTDTHPFRRTDAKTNPYPFTRTDSRTDAYFYRQTDRRTGAYPFPRTTDDNLYRETDSRTGAYLFTKTADDNLYREADSKTGAYPFTKTTDDHPYRETDSRTGAHPFPKITDDVPYRETDSRRDEYTLSRPGARTEEAHLFRRPYAQRRSDTSPHRLARGYLLRRADTVRGVGERGRARLRSRHPPSLPGPGYQGQVSLFPRASYSPSSGGSTAEVTTVWGMAGVWGVAVVVVAACCC